MSPLPVPALPAARRLLLAGALALTALAAPAVRAQADGPRPVPEPQVQRTVVEDDHTRIEELRVRGQVQRIVVQSKDSGVRPYEIVTGDAGRDPSQPQDRRAAGQRVWQLLRF